MPRRALIAAALLLGLALAMPVAAEEEPPHFLAPGLMLPGSFTGGGLRLDLWPDQVFTLRRDDTAADTIGRWHADPARRALVLESDTPGAPRLAILGNGNLRLADQPGEAGVLTRQDGAFAPFAPRLTLRGAFLYFADAGRFTECVSGRNWPVAMEGAFPELQRAYLGVRAAPQAPVTARIEGRIAERPRMEGGGTILTLVVDRVIGVEAGAVCGRPDPQATLANTYWRVLRLDGQTIRAGEGRREPHLLIQQTDPPRFAATIGCNQLLGGVEIQGATLRFRPGPSTMMACPPPLDAQEATLKRVLGETAGFRLDGGRLQLRATDGRTLAELEAVYLR